MTKGPCKDCEEREPGCHDHCIAYKMWVSEYHKAEQKLKEDKIRALDVERRIARTLWK